MAPFHRPGRSSAFNSWPSFDLRAMNTAGIDELAQLERAAAPVAQAADDQHRIEVRRGREDRALRGVLHVDLRGLDDLPRARTLGVAHPEWPATRLAAVAHHAGDAQRPVQRRRHRLGVGAGRQRRSQRLVRERVRRLDLRRSRRGAVQRRAVCERDALHRDEMPGEQAQPLRGRGAQVLGWMLSIVFRRTMSPYRSLRFSISAPWPPGRKTRRPSPSRSGRLSRSTATVSVESFWCENPMSSCACARVAALAHLRQHRSIGVVVLGETVKCSERLPGRGTRVPCSEQMLFERGARFVPVAMKQDERLGQCIVVQTFRAE